MSGGNESTIKIPHLPDQLLALHVYEKGAFMKAFPQTDQAGPALSKYRINIGIKHGFSCINIRQVPWEVLKTEAKGLAFSTPPKGPGEC